jgi:hypothetical protein
MRSLRLQSEHRASGAGRKWRFLRAMTASCYRGPALERGKEAGRESELLRLTRKSAPGQKRHEPHY